MQLSYIVIIIELCTYIQKLKVHKLFSQKFPEEDGFWKVLSFFSQLSKLSSSNLCYCLGLFIYKNNKNIFNKNGRCRDVKTPKVCKQGLDDPKLNKLLPYNPT